MKNKKLFSLFLLVFCAVIMLTTAVSGNNATIVAQIEPDKEATVTFNFDGLMALCFGNPRRASVGILNAHQHTPQLMVTKIKGTQRTVTAILKNSDLHDTLYIGLENGKSNQISRYLTANRESDQQDFRWTVDLESDLFQKPLYIQQEKLYGKIHFYTGLFYAANLSAENVRFFADDNTGKMLPFNRQVAEPASRIELKTGETLVIRGSSQQLRLSAEAGVRYEVAITNLPNAEMASMNHWLHYYDIVGARVTHYEPVLVQKAAYYPRPVMCNAAVFSQSQLD